MSLHDWPLVGRTKWVGLGNYKDLVTDSSFLHSLGLSLLFVLVATPLSVLLGLALAVLVQKNRTGAGVFRSVFFLPMVIGFAAAAYIWLWLLNPDVGHVNQILGDLGLMDKPILWLAHTGTALVAAVSLFVWKNVGFSMLLLMGGLQSIPDEIREAAAIDGAGRMRTFGSITLPMMRRTIALVLVFSTVGSVLVFEPFYILTRGGPGNSTTGVVQWVFSTSFFNFDLGYGAAASLVLLALLVFFSAFQLRAMRDES
ncbi:MAG: sugar ABC transporter permease [Propionibacteriaceae bacterium]|nr:sugar ABC transporter permease [Propionibacteriaceae bacterium]